MSSATLTPVSYLVLGLIERAGTATPYGLERFASDSIGNFWAFPRSQIYAESARLASLGLLEETREPAGRRRRTYSITPAGQRALREWLHDPEPEPPQLRYLGLLKLFFGEFASRDDIVRLAQIEEAAHRARLVNYRAVEEHLPEQPHAAFPRATLRMGILCEEAFVKFWSEVAANPPRVEKAKRRGAAGRPAARAGS